MCVVRLCLQYQGRGGPLQIGTGGHIRGPWRAVLGGAPLMADISVYARLRGNAGRTYDSDLLKLWTSVVGGKPFEPFQPFEPFEPLRAPRKISGGTGKGLPSGVRACASFGSVFNIKAVAALCRLARGGHIRGAVRAVLGGAPLMADISVYAGLGECGGTYDQRPTGSYGRR